jgi:hypothetical protein
MLPKRLLLWTQGGKPSLFKMKDIGWGLKKKKNQRFEVLKYG